MVNPKKLISILVSTLLLIGIVSQFTFFVPNVKATSIFGYDTIGSSSDNYGAAFIALCRFQAPESGTITNGFWYGSGYWGTIPHMVFVIYSDSSGTPSTLLESSSPNSITTTPQWWSFTVTETVTVGNYYWIGVSADDDAEAYWDAGVADQWTGATSFNYPPPATWPGGDWTDAYKMSVYVTYTPEVASPTFSSISTNTTVKDQPCLFSAKATANSGNLSYYVFGCNVTESWVNETVAFTNTNVWSCDYTTDWCYRRLQTSTFTVGGDLMCGDYASDQYDYSSGFRFRNITIPKNTIIVSAYLSVNAYYLFGGIPTTYINGEASDNASIFSTVEDYDARVKTTANETWTPPSWNLDSWYNSTDIKTVIQEIVDRSGWSFGNDLVVFWKDADGWGASMKLLEIYNQIINPDYAPKLYLTYQSEQTVSWVNVTKTLPNTEGVRIEWQVWANNTEALWGTTGLQYLVTTAYQVYLTVHSPISQQYDVTYFLVNMSASLDGGLSIDQIWFNCKNGTEWVLENQTYTEPVNITTFSAGIYQFLAWANNTEGTIDQESFSFQLGVAGFYAASGSPSDIQDAVDEADAEGGGNVYVPAGTFYWNGETVNIPGGVSVIGASPAGCKGHEDNWEHYTATTILHNNMAPPNVDRMFYINGANNKSLRISGIQFEATAPPTFSAEDNSDSVAIETIQCKNLRIDHCTFINFSNTAVGIGAAYGGTGAYALLDHCVTDNPYKGFNGNGFLWGYGFYAVGGMHPNRNNWNPDVTDFLGKWEAIPSCSLMYVEDCHFIRCRHSTDGIEGSWGVIRYNLFEKGIPPYGQIEAHGAQSWYSARGFEAYGNTILETNIDDDAYGNADIATRLRGGSAMIFNNTFVMAQNTPTAYFLYLDREGSFTDQYVKNTYIWSNTYTNCSFLNNRGGYTQNVDYFLRAPSQTQDGFTYTPYTYPHPLVEYQPPPQYPPTYSNVGVNSTIADELTEFHVKWQQSGGATLHGYIVGTNNTGTWQNETWTAWGGTPTSGWSNLTVTLNDTVGIRVEFEAFANNTDGLWTSTDIFFLTTSGGSITIEIDQINATSLRVDIGTTVVIVFHARYNTNQSSCESGTIYVNTSDYSLNASGWITVTVSSGIVTQETYTVTSVDVNGVTDFQQIPSDPIVTWDRWEFFSITASATRINVGAPFELRYKIRYDYDDVIFDNTKGSVSGFSWDSTNSWWKKTVISSNTVANTTYDETYVTITDQWGLTAKEDVEGVVVRTDKARIYYMALYDSVGPNDGIVDVGTSITLRVKGLLLNDGHLLGDGDTVTTDFASLTWDPENGWFYGSKTMFYVSNYTFQISSLSEATYSITEFEVNVTNPVGIYDKLLITFSANKTYPLPNETVTISWNITRQYDNSTVSSFTIDISRNSLLWGESFTNNSITDIRSERGIYVYSVYVSSVTDNTYGLTVFTSISVTVNWHNPALIYIANSSYITIENCKISNTSVAIQIHANSTNIRILTCVLTENQDLDLLITEEDSLMPDIIWIVNNQVADIYFGLTGNNLFVRDNYPYVS